MKPPLLLGLFSALCTAFPLLEQNGLQFANEKARQQNLPSLKLDYGTWQAHSYDAKNDVGLSTGW
jgi:hypothetical protein